MRQIPDPGFLFLDGDFAVEFAGHPVEFGDHHFDLRQAAALFLHLEPLKTDQRIPRFHQFHSKDAG